MVRLFLILTVSFVLTMVSVHGQTITDSAKTYKLLLIKGASKDYVISEAKTFSKNYPDIETSLSFRAPNYVLYVGQCSDINKAKQLKELLNPVYPNSIIERCTDE